MFEAHSKFLACINSFNSLNNPRRALKKTVSDTQ